MDTLLSVDNLTYRYGERVAVDGVSLDVRRGEVFGLLGPNGAGKTTFLGCVAGLLTPASGSMWFAGADFAPRTRPEQRARLGLVPQETAVYDELTARENLDFFARLQGAADVDAAVAAGLALSGLDGRADERVETYSGGMKRRLNLAVALLHGPALTLLDEPTVGVDPQSRHHVFASIEQLRNEGHAMLYTSHSMDEVQRLCDRVAILDRGRLVGTGTPAELAVRAGVPGADLERTFLELTGRSLRDAEAG
jgi:ABC-2 type transport system ATP-binding protein